MKCADDPAVHSDRDDVNTKPRQDSHEPYAPATRVPNIPLLGYPNSRVPLCRRVVGARSSYGVRLKS